MIYYKDMLTKEEEIEEFCDDFSSDYYSVKKYDIHKYIPGILDCIRHLINKIRKQKDWIDDLQSGMYVNCVYCGFRYGNKETTPTSMANILKEHVENCEDHPMFLLKKFNEKLKEENRKLTSELETSLSVGEKFVKLHADDYIDVGIDNIGTNYKHVWVQEIDLKDYIKSHRDYINTLEKFIDFNRIYTSAQIELEKEFKEIKTHRPW